MAAEAVHQAEMAQQTAARLGVNGTVRQQITGAQQSVQDLVDQIEAMKKRVANERAEAARELEKVRHAVDQAQVNVKTLIGQIQEKERAIEELSQRVLHKNVWPLGDMSVPDPEAITRAGGIRVEIAGLHGALSTAQVVLANTMQSMEALQAYVEHTPIEADPRLAQLYSKLQAEQKGISALVDQASEAAKRSFQGVLSDANKAKIAEIASTRLDTGLPDSVEVALFVDAIEKVEKALADAIPAKVFSLDHRIYQQFDQETE